MQPLHCQATDIKSALHDTSRADFFYQMPEKDPTRRRQGAKVLFISVRLKLGKQKKKN